MPPLPPPPVPQAQAATERTTSNRVGEIDALRGVAAVAVMLFHYTTRINELYPEVGPAALNARHGHYGVNLFFIISGYVIFMTLHRTRRPMDFVVSRFSRLFPAYWVAIAITFAVTHALGLPGKMVTGMQALGNFSMVHGFFGVPHVDSVYWTLEIELLFYAWMFSLYVLGRLGQVHVLLWALLALRLTYHALAARFGIDLPWRISQLLILDYIAWFAIGISIYLVVNPRNDRDRRQAWAVFFAALVVLAVTVSPGVALLALVLAALVFAAATRRLPWLNHPVMIWLGAVSYTLYLLHENIGWAIQLRLHDLGVSREFGIVAVIAISLALATALTRWVERPAMGWVRNRWQKRTHR